MKLRRGLIGVALALVITGGSAVAANAAEPSDASPPRPPTRTP
ncbi:hypothetical protein ACRAWB_08850 [Leifsonia poae]